MKYYVFNKKRLEEFMNDTLDPELLGKIRKIVREVLEEEKNEENRLAPEK